MSSAPENQINPYVGPRAFRQDEAIYGRDRETRQLINLIVAERIVLLYSPSGAGKTSLIQAALIPRLRQMRFQVLPVVRVNLDPSPELKIKGLGNRYVFSTLLSLQEDLPAEKQFSPKQLSNLSLSEYLDARSKSDKTQRFEVLIFDQFEDILTIDPTDQEEKREFFRQLGDALEDPQRWALFSMREDYVTALDPYLLPIPSRFSNTFRLDLLGKDAAQQAIREPAHQAGVEFEEGAVQKLVDDLRRVRVQRPDGTMETQLGPYVEPVQLQVVCYRLWNAKPADRTVITETDLAAYEEVDQSLVDQSLADYYSSLVADTAAETGVSERRIREWFDVQLITEHAARGTVLMRPDRTMGLENHTILRLIDAHLVRAEKRGGATWFELAHDRLVGPVRQNNAAWFRENLSLLQQQAALWDRQGRPESLLLRGKDHLDAKSWAHDHHEDLLPVEEDYLKTCQSLFQHEQRAQRLNRVIAGLGILAIVLAVIATIAAWYSIQQADVAERQARAARARQLAAQSQTALEESPQRSLLLAIEAIEVNRDAGEQHVPEAEEALRTALAAPRGEPLLGHEDSISTLAFSPDGRWLATGSNDSTARLWDLDNSDRSAIVLSGHQGFITTLAFSPDGHWLATAGDDRTIRLWDVTTGDPSASPKILAGHEDSIRQLVFSPDGRRLAAGSVDGNILVWDMELSEPADRAITLPNGHSAVNVMAFSPDGRRLVSGHLDAEILLWDLGTADSSQAISEPNQLSGHERQVTALAFSPDGRWLASGGADATAILWNLRLSSSPQSTVELSIVLEGHQGEIRDLSFSPNGRWLATGSEDTTTRLWDLSAPDPAVNPLVLLGHSRGIWALAFSPDGTRLATGGEDNSARVWDLEAENPAVEPQILLGHDEPIRSLDFRPDGRILATGSEDATARLWDLQELEQETDPQILSRYERWSATQNFISGRQWLAAAVEGNRIHLVDLLAFDSNATQNIIENPEAVWVIALSPDGRWLATGSEDATARVWDLLDPNPISSPVTLPNQNAPVSALAFSPDGRWLVSAHLDAAIFLWQLDLEGSSPAVAGPTELTRYEGQVTGLAFSANRQWLATGDLNGSVRLWDFSALDPANSPRILNGQGSTIWSLGLSPDGRWLATGNTTGTVRLWNLEASDPAAASIELRGHGGPLSSIAFSPNNRWLATASEDATIRLWDLSDPTSEQVPITLRGHQGGITNLAFSPDDRWLASGDEDGEIRIWRLALNELIDMACRIAGRNLNEEEWQTFFSESDYRMTCNRWPAGE